MAIACSNALQCKVAIARLAMLVLHFKCCAKFKCSAMFKCKAKFKCKAMLKCKAQQCKVQIQCNASLKTLQKKVQMHSNSKFRYNGNAKFKCTAMQSGIGCSSDKRLPTYHGWLRLLTLHNTLFISSEKLYIYANTYKYKHTNTTHINTVHLLGNYLNCLLSNELGNF